MNRKPDDGRDVFQRWVQPLLEQAAGFAFSYVRNHADAEDIVQEALWRGYRGMASYDRSRPFKGWWFVIVRNCCLDMLQQRKTKPHTVPVEMAHEVAARDSKAVEPLLEALSRLTPTQSEILQLRYFGGCTYRDLAEALGIPTGTVMSRLHAARQALAAEYEKD
jgi:RNA polymerase sigma-70 factor (ECF subfamily)